MGGMMLFMPAFLVVEKNRVISGIDYSFARGQWNTSEPC